MATLKTKATLDRTEFESGLDAMKRSTKEFDASLGRVGGIMAGVFGGNMLSGLVEKVFSGLKEKTAELSELAVQAKNVRMPTAELDEWIELFEQFGATKGDVISLFDRTEAARQKAIEGNADLAQSFKELGISMKDLTHMSASELNKAFAAGVAGGGAEGAAETIGGRGMKRGSVRESLKAYTEGTRADIEPLREGTAEVLRGFSLKLSNFKKTFWNSMADDATALFHDLPALITGAHSAEEESILATDAMNRSDKKGNQKTKVDSDAKNADYLASVAEERDMHNAAELKLRNDEIEKGVHAQPMNMGGQAKSGLFAGSVGNSEAMMTSRRQVEVAYRQTRATESLTAAMHEASRHMAALKVLESKKPTGLKGNSQVNAGQEGETI